MKVKSQLAFTVDYAKEFGGPLGIRLYRQYRVLIGDDKYGSLNFKIEWTYSKPEVYRVEYYRYDYENERYIWPEAQFKTRKECHKWIADHYQEFINL